MKERLIVIGASYLQVPLVLKARELGIETHVFAWEQGAVAREYCDYFYPVSIIEKDLVLKESLRIKPHGVVSIGSDLATVTVNYIAANLGLIGNSMHTTEVTTNKWEMRKTLSMHGLPCPRFVQPNSDNKSVKIGFEYPAIVKPTDRSGSRGVTMVTNNTELVDAIARARSESFRGEVIIEEFVEGKEISVEMITWKGKHYSLAMTDKVTTGAPYFIETQQHQPSALDQEIKRRCVEIVEKALTCLGVNYGASHSELLITQSGNIYIVEIGARMGGDCIGSHLVRLSTGYDFVKGVIDISLDRFDGVSKPDSNYAGIYYLLSEPGKVLKIRDKTNDYKQVVEKMVFAKEGDIVPPIRESGERLGYFIYQQKNSKFVPKEEVIAIETRP